MVINEVKLILMQPIWMKLQMHPHLYMLVFQIKLSIHLLQGARMQICMPAQLVKTDLKCRQHPSCLCLSTVPTHTSALSN